MSHLQGIEIPRLPTVTMAVDPDGVLILKGSIAARSPTETISPFFHRLHRAILAEGLQQFTLNLVGLTFVNSATIRLFVDWVTWVKHEPVGGRYTVVIHMDERVTWQKTSLGILRTLAPDVVVLRPAG